MAMAINVSVLNILLYGQPVGTLTRVEGDRTLFAFNQDYLEDETRPTLSLGFKDDLGRLITDFNPVRTRVMPFFSNLLPEGRMRTYLAERAGVNPEREFFLLWVLGKDLPGAITVEPADGEAWPPGASETQESVQENVRENALRFSLAGVQLKFSAIEDARKGLTIPAKGIGGSWIVKLPSREFDGVPENEYSMMTLARLVGIDVPAIRLIDVSAIGNLPSGIETLKGRALAIERFDRLTDGTPVHIEDFAQVFGVYPRDKYKKASAMNMAAVVGAEGGEADIAEFVRRLTFNTLIGNADMHLKNWSVIYPDRRNAAIAPAYDFVSTILYIPDETAALKVSRSKRFDEFSEDELAHMAARARLPEKFVLDTARETAALFHQHWEAEKKNLPLSAALIDAIETHFKKIPLGKTATAA
jgi:serine/threonine-protein kinase HipA